jgi:hypothetical protein
MLTGRISSCHGRERSKPKIHGAVSSQGATTLSLVVPDEEAVATVQLWSRLREDVADMDEMENAAGVAKRDGPLCWQASDPYPNNDGCT